MPFAQLLAHRCEDTLDAVDGPREPDRVGTTRTAAEGIWGLVHEGEVAMARGLGDHRLAGKDPWSLEVAAIDHHLQWCGVATHVAHGGEASVQHALGLRQRVGNQQTGRAHHEVEVAVRVPHQVDVGVTESRHEEPAAAVDLGGLDSRSVADRRVGHCGNPFAFDENVVCVHDVVGQPVEDPHVANHQTSTCTVSLRHGLKARTSELRRSTADSRRRISPARATVRAGEYSAKPP